MGISYSTFHRIDDDNQRYILFKMLESIIGEEKSEKIVNDSLGEIKQYEDSLVVISKFGSLNDLKLEECDWDDF